MGEFCGLRRPGIIVRRAGVEKEEGREAGREGGRARRDVMVVFMVPD